MMRYQLVGLINFQPNGLNSSYLNRWPGMVRPIASGAILDCKGLFGLALEALDEGAQPSGGVERGGETL
jgi:hypothetical protein